MIYYQHIRMTDKACFHRHGLGKLRNLCGRKTYLLGQNIALSNSCLNYPPLNQVCQSPNHASVEVKPLFIFQH
jgi:hypothetical protein